MMIIRPAIEGEYSRVQLCGLQLAHILPQRPVQLTQQGFQLPIEDFVELAEATVGAESQERFTLPVQA